MDTTSIGGESAVNTGVGCYRNFDHYLPGGCLSKAIISRKNSTTDSRSSKFRPNSASVNNLVDLSPICRSSPSHLQEFSNRRSTLLEKPIDSQPKSGDLVPLLESHGPFPNNTQRSTNTSTCPNSSNLISNNSKPNNIATPLVSLPIFSFSIYVHFYSYIYACMTLLRYIQLHQIVYFV